MALVWAPDVADTSTTTGTGPFTVSGTSSIPQVGRTFSAVCSTNDTFYGRINNQSAAEWVEGIFTYSGANQITVTTVHLSSNSNDPVTFSAGTKDVFIHWPTNRIAQVIFGDTGANLIAGYTTTIYTGIGTVTSGTVTPSPGKRTIPGIYS